MNMKWVFRLERYGNNKIFKFNICRFIFNKRKCCLKLALQPRIFQWQRECIGCNLTFFGFRVTYETNPNNVLC